ncbi:MAG TPA: hypothetical protein VE758_07280 [Chthoniobacterales bacterium]|jgi:hypothetical protein|nr:hypothetical protein [Chthoniobacterales bacterium]
MGFAEFLLIMTEDDAATNSKQTEAEKLTRLLELELAQKRVAWKEAGARRRNARTMSFAFLFLIILGCLFGLFFAFSTVNDQRPRAQSSPAPAMRR